MELRVLKYFLTVADEGNITRAADILHVTQPTLSRQLIELEDEMGTPLLIRGKRSVTLTEEGFLFRQQAETIVELADKLEHTFTDKKDIICGTIRIGATEAMGGRTLAACMTEFREKYPEVQFDLYNGMADNIKEMVERGLRPEGSRACRKRNDSIRGHKAVSPDHARKRKCKRTDSPLDAVRRTASEYSGLLQYPFQRRTACKGGNGVRGLSGRRAVHTCGSGALFSPDPSGTYHQERDPVEEEPPLLPGGVSLYTDHTGILKKVTVSAYFAEAVTFFVRRQSSFIIQSRNDS